jgi:hypothetical protein
MLALSAAALTACAAQPPPPPPPPPPTRGASPAEYVVVRGAQSALVRYPRGSRVALVSRICLQAGETLTVANRRTGATLTYGEGCGRRVDDDAGDQTPAATVGMRAPMPGGHRDARTAP